jgi:xanthine/uracil/vitamin C permease (AzgA family)
MVFGFVSYAPLNIIAGNTKKIHFLLCILSTLFIFRYAYLNT